MPTKFEQEYQTLTNQEPGSVSDFFNSLGSNLSFAAGGKAAEKAQTAMDQKTLLNTLSTLPQADTLQGADRNVALQFLKNNKIDDYQQTLTAAAKKNKSAGLSGAVNDLFKNRGGLLAPEDQAIVKAALDQGDAPTALSYLNAAASRAKSETEAKTNKASEALGKQLGELKGKDNKAVVEARSLVQNLLAKGVTGDQLKNIDDPEVHKALGIKPNDALRIKSMLPKIEEASGLRVGSPGFFEQLQGSQVGQALGLPAPRAQLKDTQATSALQNVLVTPEANLDQASIDQQREAILKQQEALKTQQAVRSYFAPKVSVPKPGPGIQSKVQRQKELLKKQQQK